MDRQGIINKLHQKFVVEMAPQCRDEHGHCVYFEGDRRCAIGYLLPDKLALELANAVDSCELGDSGVLDVLDHNEFRPKVKEALGIESQEDEIFLDNLQRWHDRFAGDGGSNFLPWSQAERHERLRLIAHNWGLVVPTLENF